MCHNLLTTKKQGSSPSVWHRIGKTAEDIFSRLGILYSGIVIKVFTQNDGIIFFYPTVGKQIKLARLRRNLSVAQVAERATCSPLTISRIEKGAPTVAIGIYLRVLYALQLEDDILSLAKDDELGRALQDMNLPQRERASKKE